jgi:hypothetical protein
MLGSIPSTALFRALDMLLKSAGTLLACCIMRLSTATSHDAMFFNIADMFSATSVCAGSEAMYIPHGVMLT